MSLAKYLSHNQKLGHLGPDILDRLGGADAIGRDFMRGAAIGAPIRMAFKPSDEGYGDAAVKGAASGGAMNVGVLMLLRKMGLG